MLSTRTTVKMYVYHFSCSGEFSQRTDWASVVYWAPWEVHCNNLRLFLGLGLVMVSSRVRVRIRVKVRVSIMVRAPIRTSWVVKFTIFCY